MSDHTWPGIRPVAERLDVYNEALMVYLFDDAILQVLKDSGADFQVGFAEDEKAADKQLRKLAGAGLFVAYELEQDDSIAVEIVVGAPLTKKELRVGRWFKPQRAFLKLPSGKLRVDSANTLPIHEDDQEDEPGIANVPPGDYVLTLYRLDWDELKNDGMISDDQPWLGPHEVIVLTPAAEAKAVRNKSFLRYPQPDVKIWQGKYTIDGGTFHGLAMTQYWWDNIHVNLDRAAVSAIGLQPGMSFRLEMHQFVFDVIYFGDAEPMQMLSSQWAKPLAGDRKEFGVAYRLVGVPDSDHYLTFPRVVSTTAFPIHERWMPATVTLLPERYELPMKSSEPAEMSIDELLGDELLD